MTNSRRSILYMVFTVVCAISTARDLLDNYGSIGTYLMLDMVCNRALKASTSFYQIDNMIECCLVVEGFENPTLVKKNSKITICLY